jgi:flavin reductase (DIM6/NTAB) family NADH-FMN oxidoreductase RutF
MLYGTLSKMSFSGLSFEEKDDFKGEKKLTMKEQLGGLNALYPTPTTLVGATVNGKPNFIAIAHIGIMTRNHISLSMGKRHYTNAGIKENKTFSVCLPSEDLVVETDYCGIMTGKNTDKAILFDVFYGELKTAPMIQECKICMECRLERIVDFPNNDVFIGEIVQTFVDESILSEKNVDVSKVKPLLFDMNSKKYWALGGEIATCWNIGRQLKSEET